jgi:hypothetical protein
MGEVEAAEACGLTPDEAECWALAARLATAFFRLEMLHSLDGAEVATAIHVIQDKLLARPAYRRYLRATGTEG